MKRTGKNCWWSWRGDRTVRPDWRAFAARSPWRAMEKCWRLCGHGGRPNHRRGAVRAALVTIRYSSLTDLEKTFAELPSTKKNSISHRGRGSRKMKSFSKPPNWQSEYGLGADQAGAVRRRWRSAAVRCAARPVRRHLCASGPCFYFNFVADFLDSCRTNAIEQFHYLAMERFSVCTDENLHVWT